jgi:hypothetical protein
MLSAAEKRINPLRELKHPLGARQVEIVEAGEVHILPAEVDSISPPRGN